MAGGPLGYNCLPDLPSVESGRCDRFYQVGQNFNFTEFYVLAAIYEGRSGSILLNADKSGDN